MLKLQISSVLNFDMILGFVLGVLVAGTLCILRSSCNCLEDLNPTLMPSCSSWVAPPRAVDDSWHLMKKYPKTSDCTLYGFSIEELDPLVNFRRPYSLGYERNVESTLHLMPFLRGYQDRSLNQRPRRVYLDLGGNRFDTSVTWFLQNYPIDFTEIHVFEAVANLFKIPEHHSTGFDELQLNDSLSQRSALAPKIPNWALDRIKSYNTLVSTSDGEGMVNITRFIKEELNLKSNDTLIVKMDIESSEWDVLPDWMKDPEMRFLVDELFVEIHYNHPSMHAFGWHRFRHSREEAVQLFQALRNNGFFVHSWP